MKASGQVHVGDRLDTQPPPLTGVEERGGVRFMTLGKEELEELLLGPKRGRRFTQDSPVYPDVWLAYRDRPATDREDLLLEPHFRAPVGTLAKAVQERLGDPSAEHQLAWAGEH